MAFLSGSFARKADIKRDLDEALLPFVDRSIDEVGDGLGIERCVTTGDDAQGQASVTARVDGAEHTGSGTSTDILEASALAWLEIANRAQRVRSAAPEREAAMA